METDEPKALQSCWLIWNIFAFYALLNALLCSISRCEVEVMYGPTFFCSPESVVKLLGSVFGCISNVTK